MKLKVDIKKKMGNFSLEVAFEMGCETLSILGASGSGKSMTLKCIAGIETPDEGIICLDGKILFDSSKKINLLPQQRNIGYLFQNYALFPNMTVEENIGIGISCSKEEKRKLVKEKISTFYLEGLEKKRPHQLSGGQQQRVALARMISSNPKIIMLDEPFSALDSYLRWQLEQEMMDIIENFQKPILFVSHNRDEVYRMSDRVGVIDDGKLMLLQEKKSLFHNPQLFMGAILTGCKNFTRIKRIDDNHVYAIDWQVELETSTPVTKDMTYLGIRAHHIQVVKESDESINAMYAKVLRTIDNAFTTIVIVKNMKENVANKESWENYSEIRLEMDKAKWEEIGASIIKIAFHPEDLLLLK